MTDQERYHWIVKLSEAAQNTAHTHPELAGRLQEEALRLLGEIPA